MAFERKCRVVLAAILLVCSLGSPAAGAVINPLTGAPVAGHPSLRLWLDASAANSLWQDTAATMPANDDSPVALWQDLSGNDKHVSNYDENYRPTFASSVTNLGGAPAVQFVGGSGGNMLFRDNDLGINGNDDRTVVTVWQSTGYTGQNYQHTFHMGNQSSTGVNQAYGHSAARAGGEGSRIGNHYYGGGFDSTATAVANKPRLAVSSWDGTGGTGGNGLESWWVDGEPAGSNDRAPLNTGTAQLRIGSRLNAPPAGNEGFTGDLAEVIVFDRVLTAAERSSLGSYIQNKYGFRVYDVPHVFTPGQGDVGHNGEYRLQYSGHTDAYYQNTDYAAPVFTEWRDGTYSYENMMRTWESGGSIGYLNRATGGHDNPGEIVWKLDFSETGGTVGKLNVRSATWNVSYGDYDSWSRFDVSADGTNWTPYAENVIRAHWDGASWQTRTQWENATHDLSAFVEGATAVYIRGTSGTEGTGLLGRNHAQLFREGSPQYLFDVQVGLLMDPHTFRVGRADLYDATVDTGKWRMQYDAGTDAYYQNSDYSAPAIQGWARGRLEDTNIRWVDERPTHPYQFLARDDTGQDAEIVWKYDFSATGLHIDELAVMAHDSTYHGDAWINWSISIDGTDWTDVSPLLGGTTLADLSDYVSGADLYYLKATMGGGHAIATQLFRSAGAGTYLFDTQVSLVPEPGTWTLLFLLFACGLVARRRRGG